MRKIILLLLAVCTVQCLPSYSEEGERPWYLEADASYFSKYVWRGLNIKDDHVFQPSFTLGYKDFSATLFGSMDLTNVSEEALGQDVSYEFTEVDISLDWYHEWEYVTGMGGIVHFVYPNTGERHTTELYAGVTWNTLLSPTVTLYWDVDTVSRSLYTEFSLSHSFEGLWNYNEHTYINLDLTGMLGHGNSEHNNYNYGGDKSAFSDFSLSAALPIVLDDYWKATLSVNYTSILNETIRDALGNNQDNLFVQVGCTFAL
jgi:hypothetical protein